MPTKKVVEVTEEVTEKVTEVTPERSEAYKKYAQIIEEYKVQNPVKYEMKKEAFERKLSTL